MNACMSTPVLEMNAYKAELVTHRDIIGIVVCVRTLIVMPGVYYG